jgi:hypothetical protein
MIDPSNGNVLLSQQMPSLIAPLIGSNILDISPGGLSDIPPPGLLQGGMP